MVAGVHEAQCKSRRSGWLGAAMALGAAAAFATAPTGPARAFIITAVDTGTTAGSPAQEVFAYNVTSGGTQTSFTGKWFVPAGTNGLPAGEAISGTGLFNIVGFTTTDLTLQVTLTNNTALPAASNPNFNDARITAFGLDVDPAASGAKLTVPGAVFTHLTTTGKFPAFKEVDVCIFSGVNCAGGANTGLGGNGASDTFTIDLTGSFACPAGRA